LPERSTMFKGSGISNEKRIGGDKKRGSRSES
jgi:hypothetical protein